MSERKLQVAMGGEYTISADGSATETEPQYGVLTTEHPSSSYGLPVLVMSDGRVLGAAEAGELVPYGDNKRDRALIDAALAAGYRLNGEPWSRV